MDSQIVAVYCMCDDLLKALFHHEDRQCQMSDAEIMTAAITAMLYFRGNFEVARRFLQDQGYVPIALSKSRFNRRWHRIADLFLTLFSMLGETWKDLNEHSIYVSDSFPIAAWDNYRIVRWKRYRGEVWRGCPASKKRFFYGLKPQAVAQAVVELAATTRKPLITTWMGDVHVEESRGTLTRAKLPVFRTPEPAVESFSHISTYYQNQQLLLQVPGPVVHEDPPDRDSARILIESVLAEKRTVLSEMESKALLSAFHIPVPQTVVARTVNEAIVIASQLGFPLALKINSPDVTHKSDVGGVRLNVGSAQAVREAFGEIVSRVRASLPEARIDGVAIQPMSRKPFGRELMVGVTTNHVFGPVITFGMGRQALFLI